MISDYSEHEWVKLKDAICIISAAVGGDKKAKMTLANRMRDSLLDVNCLWMAEGADVGAPYASKSFEYDIDDTKAAMYAQSRQGQWERTAPTVSDSKVGSGFARYVTECGDEPTQLFAGFWHGGSVSNWKNDVKRWDWSSGLILVTRPPAVITESPKFDLRLTLPARWFAYDARVNRSQVEVICNLSSIAPRASVKASKAGRNRDPNRWGVWIAEAIKLERSGGISVSMNANAFNEAVHNRLDELVIAGKIEPKLLERKSTYDLASVIIEHLTQ